MADMDKRDALDGEEEDRIVILQDEDGNDVPFEHIKTLTHKGGAYILLEAQQDMEDCLQGESIILKIEQDENGDDIYATIEDEAEYQEAMQKCLDELDALDDGDEADGEDDGDQ